MKGHLIVDDSREHMSYHDVPDDQMRAVWSLIQRVEHGRTTVPEAAALLDVLDLRGVAERVQAERGRRAS